MKIPYLQLSSEISHKNLHLAKSRVQTMKEWEKFRNKSLKWSVQASPSRTRPLSCIHDAQPASTHNKSARMQSPSRECDAQVCQTYTNTSSTPQRRRPNLCLTPYLCEHESLNSNVRITHPSSKILHRECDIPNVNAMHTRYQIFNNLQICSG